MSSKYSRIFLNLGIIWNLSYFGKLLKNSKSIFESRLTWDFCHSFISKKSDREKDKTYFYACAKLSITIL